jgi:hypothetical protein
MITMYGVMEIMGKAIRSTMPTLSLLISIPVSLLRIEICHLSRVKVECLGVFHRPISPLSIQDGFHLRLRASEMVPRPLSMVAISSTTSEEDMAKGMADTEIKVTTINGKVMTTKAISKVTRARTRTTAVVTTETTVAKAVAMAMTDSLTIVVEMTVVIKEDNLAVATGKAMVEVIAAKEATTVEVVTEEVMAAVADFFSSEHRSTVPSVVS